VIRWIALRLVAELANIDRIDRMNLPQRQPFKIFRVVARRIISCLSFGGAGNMTAVEEQLSGDLHWMRLEKLVVVGRVEQIPTGRTIMRNNFRDDRVTHLRLGRIFRERDVNVVVSAAEQIALDTLAIAGGQRIVFVDV